MNIIKILKKSHLKQLQTINDCLQNEGTICFPTETVYALACDATKLNAINKLYKIKDRNKNKQFSILMPDIKTIEKYATIDKYAINLIKKFSPGPITYILPNKNLTNWSKSLGVRIPNHPIALSILSHYPKPLVGTSVNISGKASARILSEIPKIIKDTVDIIVEDNSNTYVSGLSSTVVDLSTAGQYKILREGEISEALIQKFL